MSKGEQWTTKEEQRLRELYEGGASFPELATALSRSVAAIHTRVKTMRNAGYPLALRRRPWTTKEVQRLRELYEGGASIAGIATELGRTVTSVKGEVHELGLRRPGRSVYSMWRTSDMTRLVELWRQGYTTREIADIMGRKEDGVKFYLRKARQERGVEAVPYHGRGRKK